MGPAPIGTRSTLWVIPLAWAFTFQVSMSRVMPRSWPTTMALETISTLQPRSASNSAVEVAWWNPSSSTTTTSPSGETRPSSTSRTSTTRGWSAAHQGRDGRAPVARITASGCSVRMATASASAPVRMSTPARRALTMRLRAMSRNSARLGTVAATCTWPPRRSCRSKRTTRWPRSAAVTAACSPPGPPPTTTTFFRRCGTGSGTASRPVRGLSMQPSHRLRPIRPTHSWLQDRQVRMSVAWPDRALAAKSGSAIWPRTTPTRSHWPSSRARSACRGSLKRPTPTTGRPTAWRMALGMNMAYPGGTCMLASIMNKVAVATPIEVLM